MSVSLTDSGSSSLEVQDLDEVTTVEKVTAAVNAAMERNVRTNVFAPRANSSEQKMATVTLTSEKDEGLLVKGYLKIRWDNY